MFVRFHQTQQRLATRLVETRRGAGRRVRRENVAGLGSVPLEPTVIDRIAYWGKLHERLGGLGNRLDPDQQNAVMASIHAGIPCPTLEEWERVRAIGRHTKVDHRYDWMPTGMVQRAERRAIRLAW